MNHYQPKRLLITGGAGFIGSHFIHDLQKKHPEWFIVNLDKLTYAASLDHLKKLPHPEQHHFVQGDIGDADLVSSLLKKHAIDTIVHFAAESHVDRSIAGPEAFIQTNVLGTFTLLEAARLHWLTHEKRDAQSCRFHHISTDEVFGSLTLNDPAFSESTAYQPRSPYSASKAASDHLVHAYYHTYGLPITLSNCSNNYGPHQHAEKFIPTVIRACLNQTPIPIYGEGKNIRDWLYVDDHCEAIRLILTQGKVGESYNIGGNNEWENKKLAVFICELMDKHAPEHAPHARLITAVTDRKGHDFRYAIDDHKIKTELGFTPVETLHTGMEKVIRHLKAAFF
ncbi:MAG TPA: dTDP-glucose 4,6-dehydratase [Gammaproteobacteria bacterium]|jgi:dTDP-glucose 4,6-dehydratase|nr:dTDP-glucose 4,6-dehydratase [Gammaproteobacteria bacterium]